MRLGILAIVVAGLGLGACYVPTREPLAIRGSWESDDRYWAFELNSVSLALMNLGESTVEDFEIVRFDNERREIVALNGQNVAYHPGEWSAWQWSADGRGDAEAIVLCRKSLGAPSLEQAEGWLDDSFEVDDYCIEEGEGVGSAEWRLVPPAGSDGSTP